LRARDILAANCARCHNKDYFFDPRSRASLVQKEVKPGDPESSPVILRIANGSMPPNGKKVSAADLQVIREWIRAGAPDWDTTPEAKKPTKTAPASNEKEAATLAEAELLKAIVEDLGKLPESERRFIRYFSTANLLRNNETAEIAPHATEALNKLVNSLSWSPDIVTLKRLGPEQSLYRLDLRKVQWSPKIWQDILGHYPYGFIPTHEQGRADTIRNLSGARLPYLRADWFIANASVPPLYHDILGLPNHVAGKGGLEEMIGVDSAQNLKSDNVMRAGLEQSGVSRNNRAVERHASHAGYYYKSFDFASNEGRKNIFQNPLDFKEDGGEFIFSLPNGMQGYLIAKATGERLDVAPVNIVRDTSSTFDDVQVTNGLSCISCHANGMRFFPDELRQHLNTLDQADFDLDRAKALYAATADLRKQQLLDAKRFEEAIVRAGGALPHAGDEPNLDPSEEPVTKIAAYYKGVAISATQAAADCGLSLAEFKKRASARQALADLGLGRLTSGEGSIKRDIWEQDFGRVVHEIGVGEYVARTAPGEKEKPIDPRVRVQIVARNPSSLNIRLKSELFRDLSTDQLKPVNDNGAKTVTVSASESGGEVVLSAEVEDKTPQRSGDLEAFSDVAAALADDIHHALTNAFVPARVGTIRTLNASAAPPEAPPSPVGEQVSAHISDSTAQLLDLAVRTGTLDASVSVTGGPGSTFFMDDLIHLSVRTGSSCFAALYDVDSEGAVTLLYPTSADVDNHLSANRRYTNEDLGIDLKASGTPGRDRIFLIVASSNNELPGVAEVLRDPASKGVVSKSVTSFARKVRSATQGAGQKSIGASVVEFFTAKKPLKQAQLFRRDISGTRGR
jgi:hypothetical protein